MRDKLIELINQGDEICSKIKRCEDCIGFGKGRYCMNYLIADHLIANGVTIKERGEWIPKDNFDGRCSISICSKCGTEKAFSVLVSIETIKSLYPFCQKCGADMRETDTNVGHKTERI